MTTGEIMKDRIARGLVAVSGGESENIDCKPGMARICGMSDEQVAEERIKRRITLRRIRRHMMPGASEREILKKFNGYIDPDPTLRWKFRYGKIVGAEEELLK